MVKKITCVNSFPFNTYSLLKKKSALYSQFLIDHSRSQEGPSWEHNRISSNHSKVRKEKELWECTTQILNCQDYLVMSSPRLTCLNFAVNCIWHGTKAASPEAFSLNLIVHTLFKIYVSPHLLFHSKQVISIL